MPFKFDSPEPKLLSQVAAGLNELLSLEGLTLNRKEVYWTPVYTMGGIEIALGNAPPKDPVGWRFVMAKPNLGGAVAGDFAFLGKADAAKYGKAAIPATTGIYDGPAVDQALAVLLHDWGVPNPEDYQVRVLRISAPAVQALWLVPKASQGKTGGAKIVPYRTLAAGIEMKAYDEGDFFSLLKPLAEEKLQLRDL